VLNVGLKGKKLQSYGKDITIDHKTPLSRKGDHSHLNIVGCCRCCNSRKGNKTEQEYKKRREKEVFLLGLL